MAQTVTPDTFVGIANESLAGASFDGLGADVEAAATDAKAAVSEILTAAGRVTSDLDELDGRKDLLPSAGYERLAREAKADARRNADAANRKFDTAYEAVKASLVDAAQPRLSNPDRELLARDSVRTVVGDATEAEFKSRLIGLAKSGVDTEALALVGTPWFKSLAISRRVSNIDRLVSDVKLIVANQALDRGATHKEQMAGAGLLKLDQLANARTAAMSAYRHSADRR